MSINTALEARRDALREREAGFTLIELLVVVIIIGILAAIAIPIYLGVQNNAKDAAVKSDLTNAKTAIVAAGTDQNGLIPTAIDTAAASATINATAVPLTPYGWSRSANTTALTYTTANIATAPTTTWCVVGTSSTGNTFSISSTGAVKSENRATTCTAA